MFTKISVAALFAGLAAAVHAPVGDPSGNPITRPLNEIVPACKAFTITWTPTTSNTVSLLLLKGPSTNVVPIATIVEGIANSGSFVWTPASSLDATTTATGYGLQLIDDVNGQYQYSTQFGISKADCAIVASSSVVVPSSSGYPVYTPSESKKSTPKSTPSVYSTAAPANSTSTTFCTTTTKYVAPSSGYPLSTGAPAYNSSILLPSKSMSVPESLKPSATGSSPTSPPESTGAASSLKAGLSLAGAVAGLVFML